MKKIYIYLIATSISAIALSQNFTTSLTVETNDDAVLTFNNTDDSWQFLQFKRSGVRKTWMGLSNGNDFRINKEGGGNILLTGGNVGIGTSSPVSKLHVTDTKRMEIRLGGPSTSSGAVSDLVFRSSDNGLVGGAMYWNWSFRTDSWSSSPGDFVLYSHNGTNYTSPIIFQADGDVALVTGNGASRNGKVGIGTTSPITRLHVTDNKRMGITLGGPSTSSGAVADLTFKPSDGSSIGEANYWNWSFRTDSWSSSPGDLVLYSNNGTNYTSPIIFQADGDIALVTGNGAGRNGNVGIGTTNPDPAYKLSVNGSIRSKEVKVEANWSDFVFYDNYNLRTLQEVEQHINENGHLPEIPSEAEVAENGINLGEMDAKLLQKIEELTLYMIQMNKDMVELKVNNKKLEEEVSTLKNK